MEVKKHHLHSHLLLLQLNILLQPSGHNLQHRVLEADLQLPDSHLWTTNKLSDTVPIIIKLFA